MIDPFSPTWQATESWAQSELSKARAHNDSLKLDFEKTCALRGRIKALKELLALKDAK